MEVDGVEGWYPAPAKLNLFLHVLGRYREGPHAGMHELQSVFRLVDAADRVRVRARDDDAIVFSGAFGEDNLCVRAARLLQAESGTQLGAELALEKRVPVGGGMGGGSSDAATVLVVLNRLWNLGLARADLMRMGLRLGADVPFFVFGQNALAEGVGERLTALSLPPAWYVVLVPQVSVFTKEIFQDPALTRDTKALKIPPFLSGQGRNDLQPAAVRRYPEIGAALEWLARRQPQARMTGSGACVFAEFERRDSADACLGDWKAAGPGSMQGFVARGLDRHPLYDWA